MQFQIHEKYLKADVGLSVDGELMDDQDAAQTALGKRSFNRDPDKTGIKVRAFGRLIH